MALATRVTSLPSPRLPLVAIVVVVNKRAIVEVVSASKSEPSRSCLIGEIADDLAGGEYIKWVR